MAERKEMISEGNVCENRKARYHYTILETVEAGIVLEGSEVKSLRMGKANITEGYMAFIGKEIMRVAADVNE